MANVKDVVKEVIPVVAEIVTDYLSKGEKEEQNVMTTTEEIHKEVDNDAAVSQVGKYLGTKLADAIDAEVINDVMNAKGYSDCDKIKESYANGVNTGFRLGVNAANHAHSIASDALYCNSTLLSAVEDVSKNDLEFIAKALAAQNKK